MDRVEILYPERRLVSKSAIISWAIDLLSDRWLDKNPWNESNLTEADYDAAWHNYVKSIELTFEEAKEILTDEGEVTFSTREITKEIIDGIK